MIIKEWVHDGMTCALRHGAFGVPCGYVALPDNHELYGEDDWVIDEEVRVHGGVTFAGKLHSDDLLRFWVGFDMGHFHDFDLRDHEKCLRTDEECIAETNRLAEQLAKMMVN